MQFHGLGYNFPSVELWHSAEAGLDDKFVGKKAEGWIELGGLVYKDGLATHVTKSRTRALNLYHSSRRRSLGLPNTEGFLMPVGMMKVPTNTQRAQTCKQCLAIPGASPMSWGTFFITLFFTRRWRLVEKGHGRGLYPTLKPRTDCFRTGNRSIIPSS